MGSCGTCKFRRRIPGDAHISCSNAPRAVAEIKVKPGQSRQDVADIILKKSKENNISVVVKVSWNRCGIFPFSYDEGTIIDCSNYEER